MGRFWQKYRIFVRLFTSDCKLLYTGPTVKNYKVQNTVTATELGNCNCASLSCTVEDSGMLYQTYDGTNQTMTSTSYGTENPEGVLVSNHNGAGQLEEDNGQNSGLHDQNHGWF